MQNQLPISSQLRSIVSLEWAIVSCSIFKYCLPYNIGFSFRILYLPIFISSIPPSHNSVNVCATFCLDRENFDDVYLRNEIL